MTKATVDACRLLLLEAGRLYEKHDAGRPEPFNVFSVLRKETDEVHLHSRFLRALLDYPQDGHRKNLRDFLERLDNSQRGNFLQHVDPDRSWVDREFENIDILIRDQTTMHAVVIENKIEAGDQPQQLQRYAKQLKCKGYSPHLVYLTLHGHDPSEDSAGDLDPLRVSYKDLLPWLQRCQERAYDEPALRESIAQYLHLVSKLTGKDQSEEYMRKLIELASEGDNLVLIHDLQEAMTEARIALLCKLWKEIDCRMKEIPNPPERDDDRSDIEEDRIRRFVHLSKGSKYHGLHYRLGPCSSLGIEVEDSIFFGVRCKREENEDEHDNFKEKLEGHGGSSDSEWSWFRYHPHPTDETDSLNLRNPTRCQLRILADEEKRGQYVADLVTGVGELWKRIKAKRLA